MAAFMKCSLQFLEFMNIFIVINDAYECLFFVINDDMNILIVINGVYEYVYHLNGFKYGSHICFVHMRLQA
jgi:hypothetical protein